MEQTIIEKHDYIATAVNLLRKLKEVKALKRANKEMITNALEGSEDYMKAKHENEMARNELKMKKEDVLDGFPSLVEKDEELKNDLKEVKEQLSATLESIYVSNGNSGNFEIGTGDTIEMVRSFSIKPKQLSLFD